MADFVIVGGGIGGLVAARRLAIGGASVLLIERGDRLGGAVSSHVVGGLVLDAGAESFATRSGTVEALAAELGLGADVVLPRPAAAWLQLPDSAAPIPNLTLLGIPGMPLAPDVTAILGPMASARAALDAVLPARIGGASQTLGQLVRVRMGAAVLERLVTPIAGAVHSAHPDSLDPDRVAPGLRSALRESGSLARAVRHLRTERAGAAVAGIKGGVHRLVERLVDEIDSLGVEVRLGVMVSGVEPGIVHAGPEAISGRVIVAAPGVTEPTVGANVLLATLVLDEPRLDSAPRGTGVIVAPGVTGVRAHALTHATAKWEWLAERAGGMHVVRLSYHRRFESAEVIADASELLGFEIRESSVSGFATVAWQRPAPRIHALDGISYVGESVAGTGIANITAQAETLAGSLLRDIAP